MSDELLKRFSQDRKSATMATLMRKMDAVTSAVLKLDGFARAVFAVQQTAEVYVGTADGEARKNATTATGEWEGGAIWL